MKMILLGPPGCGKGTHGKRISSRYDIPIISTGDIIRVAVSSGSALGEQVKGYMASGQPSFPTTSSSRSSRIA